MWTPGREVDVWLEVMGASKIKIKTNWNFRHLWFILCKNGGFPAIPAHC